MSAVFEPWSFQIKTDFTLSGWRTRFTGKPVIVFFHGNGFSGLSYRPMLDALASDFDLIVPDLPGHGDSGFASDLSGWNDTARYMRSVLNSFSHQIQATVPILGLGHSYGGIMTALIAGSDQNRFKKTLLLDPVIFSSGMLFVKGLSEWLGLAEQTDLVKKTKKRQDSWASKQEAYEYFEGRGIFKNWAPESLQAYIDDALMDKPEGEVGVTLKCPTSVEAKIFASYPKRLWSNLRHTRTPCKILMGKESYPFIAKSAAKLEPLKMFQTEKVEGGHCFMQERPIETAKMIKDWFLQDRIL
ncbi:alpha/beta hydrolase PoxA [Oceaniserpentilla sp. 4NH20-0058]|uniref:alpha/beta fold hydrolase n=1 Tax=Oceaniserpentilla sp. 4NH20-0058 TaxID=3127660 RepID=UPI00310973C9